MGCCDKGREGKRLYKCLYNGLVTNYFTISRADAVKLLLAVAEEKGGRDRQLVHEMLIDSRAIVAGDRTKGRVFRNTRPWVIRLTANRRPQHVGVAALPASSREIPKSDRGWVG